MEEACQGWHHNNFATFVNKSQSVQPLNIQITLDFSTFLVGPEKNTKTCVYSRGSKSKLLKPNNIPIRNVFLFWIQSHYGSHFNVWFSKSRDRTEKMVVSLDRFIFTKKQLCTKQPRLTTIFSVLISNEWDHKPNTLNHPKSEHVRILSPDCSVVQFSKGWDLGRS